MCTAHLLHDYCMSEPAPNPHYCIVSAHALPGHNTCTALLLQMYCTSTAHVLHVYCTVSAALLHSHCTVTAQSLHVHDSTLLTPKLQPGIWLCRSSTKMCSAGEPTVISPSRSCSHSATPSQQSSALLGAAREQWTRLKQAVAT